MKRCDFNHADTLPVYSAMQLRLGIRIRYFGAYMLLLVGFCICFLADSRIQLFDRLYHLADIGVIKRQVKLSAINALFFLNGKTIKWLILIRSQIRLKLVTFCFVCFSSSCFYLASSRCGAKKKVFFWLDSILRCLSSSIVSLTWVSF